MFGFLDLNPETIVILEGGKNLFIFKVAKRKLQKPFILKSS